MAQPALITAGLVLYAVLGAVSMKIYDDARPAKVEIREVVIERPVIVERDVIRAAYLTDDVACLGHNIYHEARGEDETGQVQVAFTTLNRVGAPGQPDTVCGVVFKRAQFSWTAEKPYVDLSDPVERLAYLRSMRLAAEVMAGERAEENAGATHYFNPNKADPDWADRLTLVGVWGSHRFLR